MTERFQRALVCSRSSSLQYLCPAVTHSVTPPDITHSTRHHACSVRHHALRATTCRMDTEITLRPQDRACASPLADSERAQETKRQ
eukprot:2116632-Rhodomonas_salina.1